MIYITGDTHCPIDMTKLNTRLFPEQHGLTKEDYLIICGDVGIVWAPESGEDSWWQNWLEEKKFTTLFVDGNHENHQALQAYPVERWKGGKVHRIKPSVIHLMRGQVYEIDGCSFFTMGGAASRDRSYRKRESAGGRKKCLRKANIRRRWTIWNVQRGRLTMWLRTQQQIISYIELLR